MEGLLLTDSHPPSSDDKYLSNKMSLLITFALRWGSTTVYSLSQTTTPSFYLVWIWLNPTSTLSLRTLPMPVSQLFWLFWLLLSASYKHLALFYIGLHTTLHTTQSLDHTTQYSSRVICNTSVETQRIIKASWPIIPPLALAIEH